MVLAGGLLTLLTEAFPDRQIQAVGDAAYHGMTLVVAGTMITTRLPSNAALHGPTTPRTGRRARPAEKGAKLGSLPQLALDASWHTVPVNRHGRVDSVQAATIQALWYGTFADHPGRLVSVRDTDTGYDLALGVTVSSGPS